MWELNCCWNRSPSAPSDVMALVAETARGLYLLAGNARYWFPSEDAARPVIDAAHAASVAAEPVEVALWRRGEIDRLDLILHSSDTAARDPGSRYSALIVRLRKGGSGWLRWQPLDLTARVLAEPQIARAVLVALAGVWDADAAAWTRSDLHQPGLEPDPAAGAWISYRAADSAAGEAPPTAAGRPPWREVVSGPECPAEQYGPQQQANNAAAMTRRRAG